MDAFKYSIAVDSLSPLSTIILQICLSLSTPSARNNTNSGIGFFNLGNWTKISCPYEDNLELIIIYICFGEIHFQSGTERNSAVHNHLCEGFCLKQNTLLSAGFS